MMARRQPRILTMLSSRTDAAAHDAAHTEALPVIDDRWAVRVLDLSVRIGEALLVAGASASEVTTTIVRAARAYGVDPVHVDVTYNSITAAFHRSGADRPVALLRVVRGAAPDHERLLRLQALVQRIGDGLDLESAAAESRAIRRTPFRYRPPIVVAAQALLAVGVAVMFGANWLVLLLSFTAALLAATAQFLLAKARVPYFFSQIAGAFLITTVAALSPLLELTGWEAAEAIRPSVIVASGIVLMLAGLTVVGAAQDAIDGFALTAVGRILEVGTHTLGVVVGILAGLETARVVGIGMAPPTQALPLGPLPLQFLGAAVIAIAVAVYNGAGTRIIGISAALSLVAWLGFTVAVDIGFDVAAASGVGAFAGSFVGTIAAYRLHVPSVAITTAAILPLVPGAAVFRGLLSVMEAGDSSAVLLGGIVLLAGAATVGIALAIGASLGISLGQPVRASLHSVTRASARLRR
jgi:uncharacterized membrane protein YjjP (DUF1212 family)